MVEIAVLDLPPLPAPGPDGRYSPEQILAYGEAVQDACFRQRGRGTAHIVVAHLRKHPKGQTQQEISKACGLRPSTVHEVVNKTKGFHIARWKRANVRGYFSPIWCLGNKPNAPHPWGYTEPRGFKLRAS